MATINYPAWATTPEKKLAALRAWYPRLLTLWSRMSTWHNTGATLTQYNNLLPNYVKNLYPYAAKLDDASWLDFTRRFEQFVSKLADEREIQNAAIDADPATYSVSDGDVTL